MWCSNIVYKKKIIPVDIAATLNISVLFSVCWGKPFGRDITQANRPDANTAIMAKIILN